MFGVRRLGLSMVVIAALLATVLIAPVAAADIDCGSVITRTTVLRADIGPCGDYGLVVQGRNITLNLNGHTIFGTPDVGDGAGVLVLDSTKVRVMNGTVRDFDAGVVIQGGGDNAVTHVVARDNIGQSEGHPPAPGTLYGDGIAILGSSDNRVAHNVTVNNGPFSGIGVYERSDGDHPSFTTAPAERNVLMHNVVEDNVSCRVNRVTGTQFCDNIGIRLEPGVGPGTVVRGNEVRRNGLDGISMFADTDENLITQNVVEGNGFWGAVAGDGIRVFGRANRITHNEVADNSAGGISIGRRTGFALGSLPSNAEGNPRGMSNTVVRNHVGGSGVFDLWDSNVDCDANDWSRNTGSGNQACTMLR